MPILLNLVKTTIMLFCTHEKFVVAQILVNNFKYLGVLLDYTLSWKDHVEYIGNKTWHNIKLYIRLHIGYNFI